MSKIVVEGARAHNLKNIDVEIPHDKLTVITGLSGSGKSTLAFDTIYGEGQRRYMETMSAYARQFFGSMERPDVDRIEGLSPVVAIEQKTTGKNPRSTVGTVTEINDFLRLLYARAATAYSYVTGEKMVRYNESSIAGMITERFAGRRIAVMAPLVKGRKGHYRDLFESIERGDYPRWKLFIQVMTEEQARNYKVNPFDLTKVWSHKDFPLIEVGVMELNRNPENYFAEVEQSAFNPLNIVEGIGFSPDKMLQGRLFSYGDAQRYRLGVNVEQIPVNRPRCPFHAFHRDGAMRVDGHVRGYVSGMVDGRFSGVIHGAINAAVEAGAVQQLDEEKTETDSQGKEEAAPC